MKLGKRLKCVAQMITPVNKMADIGCDHGFLSVYMIKEGLCKRVIASDVNEGPLLRAKENIALEGLEALIETRVSNGFEKLAPKEADAFIIAGMGGELGLSILLRAKQNVAEAEYFIFQVQSELELVRYCFREWGFRISEERFVKDKNKFYFAMRVLPDKAFGNLDTGSDEKVYLEGMRRRLKALSETAKKHFYFPEGIIDSYGDYPEYLNREYNRLKGILTALDGTGKPSHSTEWEEAETEFKMLEEVRNEM